MSAKSDPRDETVSAGSPFYYRRSLSAGELLPAIGIGVAAGLVAFYLARVMMQRTPLVPERRPARPSTLEGPSQPRRLMRSRFAGITSRTFVLATVFAVAAAAAPRAQAQIVDISCDRPGAQEVRSLRFEGNTTFKSDELAIHVVTTPSSFTRRYFGWFFNAGSARCLPEDGLGQDVANLKGFYKNNGFYATRVDTLVTPLSPDRVRVTFRINEGPPLRADTVRITGLDSVPDRQAVLHDLLVRVGERVGQFQLYADRDSITSRLRNQGYPLATVFPTFTTHLGRERAEITLDVVTGPRTRIGTIDIQRVGPEEPRGSAGLAEGRTPGIDSAVVLDLLGFRTGNWYSDRALSEATRNLYNLGAYRHVGISIDTAQQATDTLVGVNVDLREDFLRQIQLEEGWGNLDCFRVDAQYTDKNFLDKAWRLDVSGRASKLGYGSPTNSSLTKNLCYRPQMDQDSIGSSKLNYYAGATVRQPTLFGGHWVPAYAAYTERRGEYQAYLRTTYVGSRCVGDAKHRAADAVQARLHAWSLDRRRLKPPSSAPSFADVTSRTERTSRAECGSRSRARRCSSRG